MKARRQKLMALIMSAVMVLTGAMPAWGTEKTDTSANIEMNSEEESRETAAENPDTEISEEDGFIPISDKGEEPEILRSDIEDKACGENLKYSYTESTKTLYIKGFGKMNDYNLEDHYYDFGEGIYRITSSPFRALYIDALNFTGSTDMTYIGNYAFFGNTRLKSSVKIPDKTESIGDYSFEHTKITSLDLNGRLKIIGDYAFHNCTSLAGGLTLPASLTTIGREAFKGDEGLTGSLTIPKNVTTIGEGAFNGCGGFNGLLTFENGINLEEIPKDAFRGCRFSGKMSIPGSVMTIGETAFMACPSLEEIYIPAGVESIAENAFEDCPNISKVTYGGTSGDWYTNGFGDVKGLNEDYIEKVFLGGDKVSISFDSCGGSPVDKQEAEYGSFLTQPEDPQKDRCEFRGWFTAPDYGGKKWDFDNDKAQTNITLYAAWFQSDCLVSFDSIGGSLIGDQLVKVDGLVTKPEDPVKLRNTFKGWYTFYYGDEFLHYWDFEKDTVKEDITLYAAWEQTECMVSFNSMGGSNVESQIIKPGEKAGKPVDPVRGGSSFLGWYTDRKFGEKWDFNKVVNNDLTLYAKWSGVEYNPDLSYYAITAVAGYGGTISPENSVMVPEGAEQKFTINPWDGFFIKSVSVDGIDVGTDATYTFASVTGDHTITALFSSTNGDIFDDGKSFYTINVLTGKGGSITPGGSVIVNKYSNITFNISASDGNKVSNVMVDGKAVGGVKQYTFNKVMSDHTITAAFIEDNAAQYCKVEFVADGAEEGIEPMYLKKGSLVPRPVDPIKKGYIFKGWFKEQRCSLLWNFDKDTVTTVAKVKNSDKEEYSTKLYACFIPEDKSKSPICLLSSTEKFGMWVETVIGKGCTQKLYIANSDGKKLDKKNAVKEWNIMPYGDSDSAGLDKYFDMKKLKKGILKCTKKAPLGYTAMVYTTYNGTTLHYVVTVVDKVKKMGYTDSSGKFHKSITVTLSDNRCDFGCGPQHFMGTENKYIEVYNKNRVKTGEVIYEQPDDSIFGVSVNQLSGPVYYCSARIPEYAGVTTRMEADPVAKKKKKLYYFDAYYTEKIKSYKIEYLSPDGSGKKFTVLIKKS